MWKIVIKVVYISALFVLLISGDPLLEECGQVSEIPGDLRSLAPWTAHIYFRTNAKNKFHATGAIIGPSTILSLAGGNFGINFTWKEIPRKYALQNPQNIRIGVGLSSSDLSTADVNSQIVNVRYIIPYTKLETGNKEFHYLIYELESVLNLQTPFARAVCVDPSYLDPFHSSTRQSGFQREKTSENNGILKLFNITTGAAEECEMEFRKLYRNSKSSHVSCAKLKGDESCLLHGSPAVSQDGKVFKTTLILGCTITILNFSLAQQRWFLVGLTALIPSLKEGDCGGFTTNFYSRFSNKQYSWIEGVLKCNKINEFPCGDQKCVPIRRLCNQINDCNDGSDEVPIFCQSQFHCLNHEHIHNCTRQKYSRDSEMISLSPTISSPMKENTVIDDLPSNVLAEPETKTCPELIISGGVAAFCESEDAKPINCSKAPVHTKATLRCERFYTSRYRFPSVEMKCGEDGVWAPFRSFACDPDCGIITSEYQPFLQGGKATTRSTAFPWHAAIFRLFNDEYRYICGASLVEKSILITAGHCIATPTEQNAESQFKIVLAPISSNYTVNEMDPISQIYEIKQAWIPPTFNEKTLKSDIAVIELATPVDFGGFIRPVCYLWRFTSTKLLQPPGVGDVGKIPGLGIDETGEVSTVLKFINLPVTASDNCRKASDRISPQSIFCGADGNWTTSPCRGDSGGGYVFSEKRGNQVRYVLRGVVSSGPLNGVKNCDPEKNAAFTHVDYYGDWIVDILEKIETR